MTEAPSPRCDRPERLPSQPELEPYKGVFLMGDKGGKKDKKKGQDQKNAKKKIKDKKKKDKEPKRLT